MALPANLAHFDGLIGLVAEQLVQEIEGEQSAEMVKAANPGKGAAFGSNGMDKGNNGSGQSIS